MAEFNHLVLVKFKEDVVVEDVLKGMEKLVSEMDIVKSFVWYIQITNPLCYYYLFHQVLFMLIID